MQYDILCIILSLQKVYCCLPGGGQWAGEVGVVVGVRREEEGGGEVCSPGGLRG